MGTLAGFAWPDMALRSYQLGPARAIVRAVLARKKRGSDLDLDDVAGEFTTVFSRQSGKDEMLAQIIAYLLVLFQDRGGSVVALPTLRPQAVIARDRLMERLNAPRLRGLGCGCGKASSCRWGGPRVTS